MSLMARGGGGGTGPLLGVGGGTGEVRSLWNGGGTANRDFASFSSSIGVLGGLGGGGGPTLTVLETALCLAGGASVVPFANLPASAIGGGALNFNAGRTGEGVRSGVCGGEVDGGVGEGTV